VSDLGQNLRAARAAAGMSLAALAHRTHYSKALLGHLETGRRPVKPDHLTAYAQALDVPVSRLYTGSESGLTVDRSNGLRLDPAAPLDGDYVESLRMRIRMLVDLDFQFGGDQPSDIALRLFRSVHRKVGVVPCAPGIERDLHAAVGELGEVTAWLLYDAGKHDLVRTTNLEALQLLRLAGDRSIELLTLQNMALHAGDLGRPVESLNLARMVLETAKLSPRLKAMFRTREARALAQLHDTTSAEQTFRQARSLYLDGVRDDDPAWAWWINDQELAWHDAMIRADSSDWSAAVDALQESLVLTPGREVRRRYNHLANLFYAQTRAEAWHDARETMERVAPFVEEVRSARAANTLLGGLDTVDSSDVGPSIRETSLYLRTALAEAGYGSAA
jgi:transcriptional regulator with XRE-family HTH domain